MPTVSSPWSAAREYVHRIAQLTAEVVRLLAIAARRRLSRKPVDGPRLLRESFERLSGSFLKFGQILSLQIDSLPRAYCDALLGLLDRVPPVSWEDAAQVIREELGGEPGDVYGDFHPVPLAAASIGQVHRAALKNGAPVAVKVQRPGVRRKFEIDNRLLAIGVKMIFALRLKRFYFLRDPVRELRTWTRDELDYRREGANCQLLADNAAGTPTERVPRVHWDLTTPRVLTMDFLEGRSVSDYLRMLASQDEAGLEELRRQGFVPGVFLSNVISNFLSDAFRFGVFHADLHPANLLILPGNVVGYVDFGIVATLTPEARRKQIELTLAYSSGDPKSIYESFLNIWRFGSDADLEGLRRRIQQLAGDWYEEHAIGGRVRFKVTVTRTMMDLLAVCRDYHVLVDREMIKYIRSTILADGLVSRLAPDFDLAQVLRGVVEQYLATEAQQRVFSRQGALSLLTDATLWIGAGPGPLLHALSLLDRRQFRVRAAVDSRPQRGHALRMRAIAVAVVWTVVVSTLALGGGLPVRAGSWHTWLAAAFVISWGVWLLRLLRQLVTQ